MGHVGLRQSKSGTGIAAKRGMRVQFRATGRRWRASNARRLSAVVLLCLGTSPAFAETVNIPASRDNTIFDESGALSNGAGSWLFAGETNEGALRRALLAFDIAAAVPPASTITSATLTLFCSRTRTGDTEVALHRLLADWGEGASNADEQEGTGATALAGDATWTKRFHPATAWMSEGGDYLVPASASAIVGKQGESYSWTSSQMRADVQLWLGEPDLNYGWLLIGNEADLKVAKRFDSRQNATAATRPVLTVTFNAPAPTGACCDGNGSCTVVLAPGGSCSGSWQGSGSTCEPNPCPQPTGACCLPEAAATCALLSEADCSEEDGDFHGVGADCEDTLCPVVLEPFVDALPIPAVADPVAGTAGGAATYDLAIREVAQKLHRDLPPTRVWGFGDGATGASFPGPTIEATSGTPVTVNWINDLRESGGALRTTHALPVDHCPHGAHDSSPRTVIHPHGGHVPQHADGYPESTFLPGQQATYQYPNSQLPATLWYHDHALGITRLNVYMGMAGFYLLRDPAEAALGLPSGEYEIALAIQDRTLRSDGSLVYPAEWQEHFFGDTPVLNGKVRPYLEVKRGKYRFRVLDGSTSRTYTLSLSSGATFLQVGTDGGLLAAPVPLSSLTIAPGERADLILDFSGYPPGTELYLTNSAAAPYPGGASPSEEMATLMKFVVLGATGHVAPIPATLASVEKLEEQAAVVERDFQLRKGTDACTGTAWLINDLHWDDITEYPELGTTEVWRFVNRSGVMHPMHMHLVMFQVLDRQSFTMSGETIVPIGSPVPPPANEAGWKDTVQVGSSQLVRVIARFEDYKGKYPYHCHILEHEDHEMMRQFETVSCGDGEVDPGEDCDLSGANGAGSCCTNACTFAAASAVCRASTSACDLAEHCSGSAAGCPVDQAAPDGTPCTDDADVCTDDTCKGAACIHLFDESNDPTCAPTTTTTLETTTTTTTTETSTTTLPPESLCGDATGNDELTATDALLALRTAVESSACPACICDVNASGGVLASDALLILQASVGLPVELHCPAC